MVNSLNATSSSGIQEEQFASSSFASSRQEPNNEAESTDILDDLPYDVFSKIIGKCDDQSLRALSCTCKALSEKVPAIQDDRKRYKLNVFVNSILTALGSTVSQEIKAAFEDIQQSACTSFGNFSSWNEHIVSIKKATNAILSELTNQQLELLKTISPPRFLSKNNIFNIALIGREVQQAKSIANPLERREALTRCMIAFALAGDMTGARDVARMIPEDFRPQALGEVVKALVATQQIKCILEAKDLALAIPDDFWRSQALTAVVRALAGTQQLEYIYEAKGLAQAFRDDFDCSQALTAVVAALADTQQFNYIFQAQHLAQEISDVSCRLDALYHVVRGLAATQQLEYILDAKDLLQVVQAVREALVLDDDLVLDDFNRSEALYAVVMALVATEQVEYINEARVFALEISNDVSRKLALEAVERALKSLD